MHAGGEDLEACPPHRSTMHRIAAPVAEIALVQHCEGMSKKKRRRSRTPQRATRAAAEQSRTELRAVVADYRRWRSSAADADAAGEADLIRILLELKAEELHCPDPGMWSSQIIAQLFLDLLGRRPLLTTYQAALLQGAVLSYFAFLHETNRWHTCAASIEVACWLVGSFTISTSAPHHGDRGLPAPVPELIGGDVGEGVGEDLASGLLDAGAIREVFEQIAYEIDHLHEDVARLSSAGGELDSWDDADAKDNWPLVDNALSVLERLDGLRAVLDRLETDLWMGASLR